MLEETIQKYVDPEARLVEVKILPGGKQGYSGSVLVYYQVSYRDSQGEIARVKLLTKQAPSTERRVLQRLSQQNLPAIAFSHTLDLVTDTPLSRLSGMDQPDPIPEPLDLEADASMLVCQQYLENETPNTSPEFKLKAAQALAAIHHANLGKRDELNWLPATDTAFYNKWIVGEACWPFWRENLKIAEFERRFGHLTRPLELAAERFMDFARTLWQEGNSLTLIHADLHGEHVLSDRGQPYIIDWGQAHYGPFYLDLPNYFTPDLALQYRDALARLGHEIPRNEFMERYREAGRYVGFKYLSVCLWTWRELEPKYDDSRLGIIEMALNGAQ